MLTSQFKSRNLHKKGEWKKVEDWLWVAALSPTIIIGLDCHGWRILDACTLFTYTVLCTLYSIVHVYIYCIVYSSCLHILYSVNIVHVTARHFEDMYHCIRAWGSAFLRRFRLFFRQCTLFYTYTVWKVISSKCSIIYHWHAWYRSQRKCFLN